VGGEDGRSIGGAVSLNYWRLGSRTRCASSFVSVFVFLTASLACSHQNAAPKPDAATRLQSIAVADSAKYPSLQGGKHWSNPYLVIRSGNVGLLSDVAANEEQLLKPEEVLNALAQLPAPAWPYGRAVAILLDEKNATSEEEKVALRRNRGIVEGDLVGAHVAIRWIPNS
jgi:hypothetical protein